MGASVSLRLSSSTQNGIEPFGFGYGEKVRLTFEIETEAGFHLTETPLSPDQDVQVLTAEWMQISATVVDSAMLEWWLRGFGEAVRNIRKTAVES